MGNIFEEENQRPIGIMDSGLGGLSVVAHMQRELACENIIYFGDSIHCPYGIRSRERVLLYSKKIINFLLQNKVKAIVIACNTISTQIEELVGVPVPLLEIISPAAAEFSKLGLKKVGIIATPFTVRSGSYERLIKFYSPETQVYGVSSPNLATLIESAAFDEEKIKAEIAMRLSVFEDEGIDDVIWGCTHYPIAENCFREIYPDFNFYNPAKAEVLALKKLLTEKGLLNLKTQRGKFVYCTSGYGELALKTMARLQIAPPQIIKSRQIL